MSPILQSLADGSARGYGAFFGVGAGGAFESIATATGTGSSNTITFSSIPGTYQHLQLRIIGKVTDTSNSVAGTNTTFNSDTGNNYACHYLAGNGTTVTAGAFTTRANLLNGTLIPYSGSSYTDMMGVMIVDIHDYASTSKYKTTRTMSGLDSNGATSGINLWSGLWMSTSAITSISIVCTAFNWTTTSQFALYGVKGA